MATCLNMNEGVKMAQRVKKFKKSKNLFRIKKLLLKIVNL